MADDDSFDVCECIHSKLTMQRLLLFLRETQGQCTDTDCFMTVPRLSDPHNAAADFYALMLLVGFLMLMYIFRPSSLRQVRHDNGKDREPGPGSPRDPPPPTVD